MNFINYNMYINNIIQNLKTIKYKIIKYYRSVCYLIIRKNEK